MSQYQSTPQFVQIVQIIKAKGLNGQFVASSCNELFSISTAVGLKVWVVPPSLRGTRQGLIESAEQKPGSNDFLLRITGVEDLSAASELVGRYLLAAFTDVLDAATKAGYHSGTSGASSGASSVPRLWHPNINNAITPCHPGLDPESSASTAFALQLDCSSETAMTGICDYEMSSVAVAEGSSPTINFTDIKYGNLGQLLRIDQTPAYQLWVVDGPYGELIIPAVDEYLQETTPELITLKLPKGFLEVTAWKSSAWKSPKNQVP